ncbi:cytochrome C oxidase subunit IV family protein [Halomonas shantousis]
MKPLTWMWIVLLELTVLSWTLGHRLQAAWLPILVLGLTALKGQIIIDGFMELAHAPRLFRYFVSGWLMFVLAIIAALEILA